RGKTRVLSEKHAQRMKMIGAAVPTFNSNTNNTQILESKQQPDMSQDSRKSQLLPKSKKHSFIGFARIFSGTISENKAHELSVFSPQYNISMHDKLNSLQSGILTQARQLIRDLVSIRKQQLEYF